MLHSVKAAYESVSKFQSMWFRKIARVIEHHSWSRARLMFIRYDKLTVWTKLMKDRVSCILRSSIIRNTRHIQVDKVMSLKFVLHILDNDVRIYIKTSLQIKSDFLICIDFFFLVLNRAVWTGNISQWEVVMTVLRYTQRTRMGNGGLQIKSAETASSSLAIKWVYGSPLGSVSRLFILWPARPTPTPLGTRVI